MLYANSLESRDHCRISMILMGHEVRGTQLGNTLGPG